MFGRFLKLSQIAFFVGMIFSFHSEAATGGTPLDDDQQSEASSMALVSSQGQPAQAHLPVELIGEIAQFLDPQDCKNLRLTCLALAHHINLPNIKITPQKFNAEGFPPTHLITAKTKVILHDWRQFPAQQHEAILGQLTALPHLHKLDLSRNDLGAEGARHLVPTLSQLTHLHSLNLCFNDIGAEGARHLASALPQLTQLQFLYLRSNNLGVEGTQHLATTLPQLTHLHSLNLSSNNLGSDGIQHLVPALPQLTHLRSLDLGHNDLDFETIQHLFPIFPQGTHVVF